MGESFQLCPFNTNQFVAKGTFLKRAFFPRQVFGLLNYNLKGGNNLKISMSEARSGLKKKKTKAKDDPQSRQRRGDSGLREAFASVYINVSGSSINSHSCVQYSPLKRNGMVSLFHSNSFGTTLNKLHRVPASKKVTLLKELLALSSNLKR